MIACYHLMRGPAKVTRAVQGADKHFFEDLALPSLVGSSNLVTRYTLHIARPS
jgi:hypothetical protein